jgi:glycosyltransferase involved in cell wall biosynthesis
MLVSFVVPTYNRSCELRQCLQSILSEPGGDYEIVVSNNASPDDTAATLKEFSYCPAVRVLTNEINVGAERNILRLIEEARGDYVFCLSDDDYLVPGALDVLVNTIEANPRAGVICGALTLLNVITAKTGVENFGIAARPYEAGAEALVNLFWRFHIFSGTVVRRDLLDLAAFRAEIGQHLYGIMVLGGSATKKATAVFISRPIVVHRVGNITSWEYPDDMMLNGLIGLVDLLCQDLPDGRKVADRLWKRRVPHLIGSLLFVRKISFRAFIRYIRLLMTVEVFRASALFWVYVATVGVFGASATVWAGRLFRGMTLKRNCG